MQILSFDTSGPEVHIALMQDGAVIFEEIIPPAQKNRQESASMLLPSIDAALKRYSWQKQDLDALVVGVGPGSFTGVRVAAITARSIGQALGIAVIPISYLEVLAWRIQLPCAIALNAGSGKLYIAAYCDESEPGSSLRQPPIAGAGQDRSIILPASSHTLSENHLLEAAGSPALPGSPNTGRGAFRRRTPVEIITPFCGSVADLQSALTGLNKIILEPGLDESVLAKDKTVLPFPAAANIAADAACIASDRIKSSGNNCNRQVLAETYPWDNVLPLYLRSPSVTLKKAENGSSNQTPTCG